MHGPRLRPVPVPGLQQEVALSRQFHRRVDPLLHREGTSRNGWQPTADVLLTMELRRQPVAIHGNGLTALYALTGLLLFGALIAITLVKSAPAPSVQAEHVDGEVVALEEAA